MLALQPNGTLMFFLSPSVLQWQPIRYPDRPRRRCRSPVTAAVIRKCSERERAEFLNPPAENPLAHLHPVHSRTR